MEYSVAWSRIASVCLDEIAYYIALDNVERALSFHDELVDAAEKIKDFPLSGSPRILGGEQIRVKIYKEYVISYRIDGNKIVILYVHKENIPFI